MESSRNKLRDLSPDDVKLVHEMLELQRADTLDKKSDKQFTEIEDVLAAITVFSNCLWIFIYRNLLKSHKKCMYMKLARIYY